MQRLKAETYVGPKTRDRRESEPTKDLGSERRDRIGKERPFWGLCPPDSWDFTALMPIPVD
jgi:hypothetical protein